MICERITQKTLCLQVQLYEDFAKSRAKVNVEDSISVASNEEEEKPKLKATGHVFQVKNVLFFTCFMQTNSIKTQKADL